MSAERWQKIKEIFFAAQEQAGSGRQTYLAGACEGDEGLREEIESLLASYDKAEDFIENPAFDVAGIEDGGSRKFVGHHIGPYKILSEIGRGGMGAVFLAERDDAEFRQRVALKLIRRGLDTEDVLRRFRNERQILAALNHPHVARLFDGGSTDTGLPYFVMEYIEGLPLVEYCDGNKLSINERLKLFRKVCEAVAYAHRNLVIHRDLKPSNILVAQEGEPKLLDFGVAKFLNPELFNQPVARTAPALRIMTPEYASPEQVQGRNVTTATDVYSLGVILYELLTAHRPYRLTSRRPDHLARAICDEVPEKPSTAIGRVEEAEDSTGQTTKLTSESVGAARSEQPRSLRRILQGDLDNIVLMALRKEPERRYKSIEAFAADIERFLKGRPITARPNTLRYRAEKFVRRNTLAVIAASLIFLSVVAGIAATVWQARNAKEQARVASAERDRARLEADKAARVSLFLQSMMLTASPNWNTPGFGSSSDVTLIEVIDEAAQRVKTEFADQPESLAKIQHNLGLVYTYRGRYEEGESQLRAAYELSLRLYGEEHPETLQNTRDLAAVLMLKGEYDESGALYQKALVIYRKRLDLGKTEGNTLLGFAGTLSDVGFLHRLKGEPKIAEPFLHESLQQSDKFTGSARAVVAIPLSHLGMARYEQGDLDDAEKYVRQSIVEYRRLPGNLRVEVGGSLLNLGKILMTKGDYKQAEVQIRECLELYRQRLGNTHPHRATAVSHLSHLKYLEGDYAGAAEDAVKALELSRKALPEKHPNIAYPLTTLGLILTRRGQPASGEKHLREALEIRRRVMSEDSWLIAETAGALGECLRGQKRFEEAERLLLRSYESLKLSQVTEYPRIHSAKRRLTELYTAWNKREMLGKYR
jgi:eukaryotic-like serine/threonine-protein kinase